MSATTLRWSLAVLTRLEVETPDASEVAATELGPWEIAELSDD